MLMAEPITSITLPGLLSGNGRQFNQVNEQCEKLDKFFNLFHRKFTHPSSYDSRAAVGT